MWGNETIIVLSTFLFGYISHIVFNRYGIGRIFFPIANSKTKIIFQLISVSAASLLIYIFIIRMLLGWQFIGAMTPYLFYLLCFCVLDIAFCVKNALDDRLKKIRGVYNDLRGLYLTIHLIALFIVFPYSIAFTDFLPDTYLRNSWNNFDFVYEEDRTILDNTIIELPQLSYEIKIFKQ